MYNVSPIQKWKKVRNKPSFWTWFLQKATNKRLKKHCYFHKELLCLVSSILIIIHSLAISSTSLAKKKCFVMKLKYLSERSKISEPLYTFYFNFYKLVNFLLFFFSCRESNFNFFLLWSSFYVLAASHVVPFQICFSYAYQHCAVTTMSVKTENSLNTKTLFYFFSSYKFCSKYFVLYFVSSQWHNDKFVYFIM